VNRMHKLTFSPGNADCCRIDLESGKQILLDYADMKCYEDPSDKRIALPSRLKVDLNGRGYYDVVGYTHLDDDHVCGSSEFFHLEHAPAIRAKVGLESMNSGFRQQRLSKTAWRIVPVSSGRRLAIVCARVAEYVCFQSRTTKRLAGK